MEGAQPTRCEHDHTVGAPRSAPTGRRLTQTLRWTACRRHLFQLATREESDRGAVWRPKRKTRAIAVRHEPSRDRFDATDPEPSDATGTPYQRDGSAVGRHGHVDGRHRALRWKHHELHGLWRSFPSNAIG